MAKGKRKIPKAGKCTICNCPKPDIIIMGASFCNTCVQAMSEGDEALDGRMVWDNPHEGNFSLMSKYVVSHQGRDARMKYDRDILTIEEIQSTPPDVWDAIMKATHYDIQQGDFFFVTSKPTKAFFIEEITREDDQSWLVDPAGNKHSYEDSTVLFSANTLIQVIAFFNQFELRGSHGLWIVIYENDEIYRSDKDELLVSFLWRVLKDLVAKDILD